MSTVTLVGAFGQGNPGDEALCAAFREQLADHELIVVSGDPSDTARRHGVRTVPQRGAADGPRRAVVGRARHRWRDDLQVAAPRRPGERATACCATRWRSSPGPGRAARKVAMIGVGADDLRGREAQAIARWLVRHVDLLVLRDEESAAVLTAAGAPSPFWIGADPAWTLRRRRSAASSSRSRAASRRSRSRSATSPATPRSPPTWRPRSRPFMATHSIRLQPWQVEAGGRDQELAETLRELMGPDAKVLDAPASFSAAVASIVGDDLVVGLRFHALVAAGMAGTRFLAVAHEPKLAGLSRRLGQVSVPVHATAEVLHGAVAHALAHDPVRTTAVERRGRRAERSFGLLRLLLVGRRGRRARSCRRSPALQWRRPVVSEISMTDLSIGRRLGPVHLTRAFRPQVTVMGGQLAAGVGNLLFASPSSTPCRPRSTATWSPSSPCSCCSTCRASR